MLGIPSALLVLLAIGDGKAGLVSGGLFYIAICLAIYFLPTIVAMLRRQPFLGGDPAAQLFPRLDAGRLGCRFGLVGLADPARAPAHAEWSRP
ncbi:hypothetical protein WDM22_38570 [Bradyrhizobium septentrionale]